LRESLSIKEEIFRKLIHFSGLLYIPSYNIFGREILFSALLSLIPFVAILEFFRIRKGLFGCISREYEKRSLGAYVYFLISLILLTSLFPRETAFVAVLTAVVGDGTAGILRRMQRDFLASLAMFASSMLSIHVLGLMDSHSAFAVLIGTLVERIKRVGRMKIEDNLSVPISAALADSVKYIS